MTDTRVRLCSLVAGCNTMYWLLSIKHGTGTAVLLCLYCLIILNVCVLSIAVVAIVLVALIFLVSGNEMNGRTLNISRIYIYIRSSIIILLIVVVL